MFFHKLLYRLILLRRKNFSDPIYLYAILILFISIFVTVFVSVIISYYQRAFLVTENLWCQDISILIGSKIIDLLDSNNYTQLLNFIDNLYVSTANIQYILVFRIDDTLLINMPSYNNEIYDLLQLHKNSLLLDTCDILCNIPIIKYTMFINNNLIDISIPLVKNGYHIASLYIGIRSKSFFYNSLEFVTFIDLIIFFAIICFACFITLINYILFKLVIDNIMYNINIFLSAYIHYKMNLSINSRINNLLLKFNQLSNQFKCYQEQNIKKLNIEKKKLELVFEIIDNGVIIIDSELNIVLVNTIAISFLDYTSENLIGNYLFDYLPLHIKQVLLPVLDKVINNNSSVRKNSYDKQEICINVNIDIKTVLRFILNTIIDQTNCLLIGVVILIKDISQEMSINETNNQFMSNVSHELRTPLCNISSLLETLLDYNDSLYSYQKIQFLKIANHETKRLSKLVNDILDLSKLDSNATYVLTHVDLYLNLKYIINTFQIIAENNNIRLILEIDPSIQYVLAHESSLYQVFYNLLSNSIKFTTCGSQIIIRVYSLISLPIDNSILSSVKYFKYNFTNFVRVEIIDEGIGIDKCNQEIIFNRFIRIENYISTLQGTGLGLSIVQNILNKYEISIGLNSFLKVGTSLCFNLIQIC